jgi:hypothetical protein
MSRINITAILLLLVISIRGQETFHNLGNLTILEDGTLAIYGDFTNNGTFSSELGTTYLVGNATQNLSGDSSINTYDLVVNNSSGVSLSNELSVEGNLTFFSGIISTDRANSSDEFVHFLAGSSYSGTSNSRYVDGVVRKSGNTAFTFPVGDNSSLRPIGISAPLNVSDQFTAYYNYENPGLYYTWNSLENTLENVSSREFWILDRNNGSSSVAVTLSWDASSGGVNDMDFLRVSNWDGSQWSDAGNQSTSGTNSSGAILGNSTSSFGPFTLGSTSFSANSLPIVLLEFNATPIVEGVKLQWKTASEINNDYFTLERSVDGEKWDALSRIDGAGTSYQRREYGFIDRFPVRGTSYYRLMQTDYDGSFTYSPVRVVTLSDEALSSSLRIYPNPAKNNITIEKNVSNQGKDLRWFDLLGKEVSAAISITTVGVENGIEKVQADISALPMGTYLLYDSNKRVSIVIKH